MGSVTPENLVSTRIQDSIDVKTALRKDPETVRLIESLGTAVCETLIAGGKILLAGNGGSFADSIHLAAEFVARFQVERDALAAIALGANNSCLTAIGNDYCFEDVFARELRALGQPADIFVGISTSGNSENIVRAVREAQAMGMEVYCLTGQSGGKLGALTQCIRVPSQLTARIQEAHILIGHIVCEMVERSLVNE